MKEKSSIPINQEEISHYLKDIRKIKVMTPERERELAERMLSGFITEEEIKEIVIYSILGKQVKNIKPNSTEDIDIPITLNQKGVFEFKYNILEVNGVTDAYNFNDSLQSFSFCHKDSFWDVQTLVRK